MIVISKSLALAYRENPVLWADTPVFGWRNVVTFSNINADKEAAAFPAANLANESTGLRWQGIDAGAHVLTVTPPMGEPLDYVGLARHNFGTGRIGVRVEAEDPDDPGSFGMVVEDFMPANDAALFVRFAPVITTALRIILMPAMGISPRAAVLYAGRATVMPRGVEPGYTPLVHGIETDVQNNRSERGNFLGRIVRSRQLTSSVSFRFLDAAWFRSEMVPFIRSAQEAPFFFAWAPQSHPDEAGYAWLKDDPSATIANPDGSFDLNLSMSGIG
ncbi:hypothetical protein [Terrihabitans sp. B22-R8]|uniref:hypothetical protein n=1 Tax=Terrihabitans sp. B22-R8 TaxID=3425128 RepID=UPI00403C8F9B